MNNQKIVTTFINPPIPIRSMDWIAYFEGCEEDQDYGRGRSEANAVQDLLTNHGYIGRKPEYNIQGNP